MTQEFANPLEYCQVATQLFELHGDALGGPGQYQLSVELKSEQGLSDYYSTLRITLERVHRVRFFD